MLYVLLHEHSQQDVKTLLLIVAFLTPLGVFAQDEIPSYAGNAVTADTSSSIVLVGDLQLQSPVLEFWRENNRPAIDALCEKIASEKPGFVLMLGDLTFDGASEKLWTEFDAYAKPIRDSNIRAYPLFGNHEYFTERAPMYYQFFSRFPHIAGRLYYLVKWHDVAFIILNSNFSKITHRQKQLQQQWYERTLNGLEHDSTVASIVVSCHHPPYTNSKVVSDDTLVQNRFVRKFDSSKKTVLFITGHCHSFEHFIIGGKHFITSGGGGPRQASSSPPCCTRSIESDTASTRI